MVELDLDRLSQNGYLLLLLLEQLVSVFCITCEMEAVFL